MHSLALRACKPCLAWLVVVLMAASLALPGCGGCRKDPKAAAEAEKKRKEAELKKQQPKKDFEYGRLTLQPTDPDTPLTFVKPGHWVSAVQEMKANNFDFVGQVEMAVVERDSGSPIRLAGTPYQMSSLRPAALPKGQQKALDVTLFVPHEVRSVRMSSVLSGRSAALTVNRSTEFFSSMAPYEYYFVVLSAQPKRYDFLRALPTVSLPHHTESLDGQVNHYRVAQLKPQKPLALPGHVLAWTSIACVLWDDLPADTLAPDQQQALLDWIHWGGQLIISGPESLEGLRDSFLAPYLPAHAGETFAVTASHLEEINRHWTLPEKGKPGPPLAAISRWHAAELAPQPPGDHVPKTGGLLAERTVGGGRIVASAFRLSERDATTWNSFDNFFNGCVLRRPPRRYSEGLYAERTLGWADSHDIADPARVSQVNFATRGMLEGRCPSCGAEFGTGSSGYCPQCGANLATRARTKPRCNICEGEHTRDECPYLAADPALGSPNVIFLEDPATPESLHYAGMASGGAACWNPYSSVSNAARESLRTAAGVTVPKARLIVWVLGLYLLVLVPVNWLLFWSLGRVELAWIAAPIIALVCSVWVVKVAQLDIGFVRSRTELAVLEVQGSYPRGHLTRYTALYSSLSSAYDLQFDTPDAVVQPFPVEEHYRLLPGQRVSKISFRRYDDARLEGLQVASNTTSLVHSEQMVDLDGPIELRSDEEGRLRLYNGSRLELRNAYVVRRVDASTVQACLVSDLAPQRSAQLDFQRVDAENPLRGRDAAGVRFELGKLKQMVSDPRYLPPGGVRLVAHVEGLMPGMRVRPESSQVAAATVVVVHLDRGVRPAPRPDANSPHDFRPNDTDD